jgi:ribose 5-phosphate isomerase B
MLIAIASDHGGYPLKNLIKESVTSAGHTVIDLSEEYIAGDDYPDYAKKLGEVVTSGRAERGVLICGSGVGASIAANKIKGIYAAVCHDTYSAHQGVEHDNMNVLCLGARVIGAELAKELVDVFISAQFSKAERHVRRVSKIYKFEQEHIRG